MTTISDQLEARIDRFGKLPLTDTMSMRDWHAARGDMFSTALFHLLGMLSSMTEPTHPAPTKTGIARAITASLDRAEPESAEQPTEATP